MEISKRKMSHRTRYTPAASPGEFFPSDTGVTVEDLGGVLLTPVREIRPVGLTVAGNTWKRILGDPVQPKHKNGPQQLPIPHLPTTTCCCRSYQKPFWMKVEDLVVAGERPTLLVGERTSLAKPRETGVVINIILVFRV